MGIPFLFASLIKSHRGITAPVKQRLDVDVLGVDFNCLIHRYLKEEDPVQSVVDAFEHIVNEICRPKHLLIAMDGVVPYAKIVQQRYRRMRTPENESPIFDRNQISPGTPYMKELEKALAARFPYASMSGTLEEGEGEHKLFQMIRKLPESERKTISIYGLDADLILICLQHMNVSQTMTLLRESGEFNDPKLETAEFSTLLIQSLAKELPLSVDQYIALSVLCFGNDFMPNLGMFSLREGGYERALEVYEKAGNPDLLTFEGRDVFLDFAEQIEMKTLKERITLRRRPDEKAMWGRDGSQFERMYKLHVLDGIQDTEPVVRAFWTTFHWTLHYFRTNEVLDWDWVYPYPDAPLLKHIMDFEETPIPPHKPRSFTVTNQLQFILPAKSLRTSRKLVKFPDEIYTETRNPWMKRHDWEMEPRISLPWNPATAESEIAPLEIRSS
jgi:5'-3' exonuclease